MKNIKDKKCENCRYFVQHYSKRGSCFRIIDCWHCENPNVTFHDRNIKPHECSCEFWQDIQIKQDERKKGIEYILRDMARHVGEIAMILKDDIALDKDDNNQ